MNIPITGKTYTTYYTVSEWCICVYKKLGVTPLQVVTEVRSYLSTEDSDRCTYIGRLDPMAEGYLYVLWSGNPEEKNVLAKQNKMYEIEVLFGMHTDTGDVLGKIDKTGLSTVSVSESDIASFVGPFIYPYPAYSSPHIKKTLQGQSVDVKKQNGHIYAINIIDSADVSSEDISVKVFEKLGQCQMDGDFRLPEIKKEWTYFFSHTQTLHTVIMLQVACSSGTYMRTLAEELAKKLGAEAIAFSIVRTKMIS